MKAYFALAGIIILNNISLCRSGYVSNSEPALDKYGTEVDDWPPCGWGIFKPLCFLYRLGHFHYFYNANVVAETGSAEERSAIEEISFGAFEEAHEFDPIGTNGPFCGCAVDDEFGLPDDWESMNIWLDIVIILDTSEAMGDVALTDASILIDLLIGDGDVDILNTNSTDEFYTRVGLIAMSDKAQVLYNLNMTKADKVLGKVKTTEGLSEINLEDGFDAAFAMFTEGLINTPDRENTRQVIYYMTNSDSAITLQKSIKHWPGVIIVNHFVDDEREHPRLKELASAGYYHKNHQDNYMDTIQLFCKANCFCGQDKVAYAGRDANPAIPAAGGCFSASPTNFSFNEARRNCDNLGGGRIASVHDEDKAIFIQKQLAGTVPESSKFWIGYSQVEDSWKWEDKSSNPTTNWDMNQPDPRAFANCAYAHATKPEMFWGADNCNSRLPSVCEFAPCSVGNKNC